MKWAYWIVAHDLCRGKPKPNRVQQMSTSLICFKYRSPSAALRCLAEGTLYFAKPSELNDTLEAKYEHATPEDFIRVVTQVYSNISQQRGGQALAFDQRGMAEMAKAHARECQSLQAFTEQIGIFSAAQRPDHQAMWAYYADNSAGVCFELEWSDQVIERHKLWKTQVQYCSNARIHNRAEDWSHGFLELAREQPKANLETLHWLSLKRSVRRAWGARPQREPPRSSTPTGHTSRKLGYWHPNQVRCSFSRMYSNASTTCAATATTGRGWFDS